MNRRFSLVLAAAALLSAGSAHAAQSAEERSLNELRLTVVNLLQGLVDQGVLTREQATAMVDSAQRKAAEDAAAAAAVEQAEAGAVRVPYVPQIVRDQIRKEVVEELTGEVAKEVVEQAKAEQWGVPAALPGWITRMRWSGDIRVRSEADIFADDNLPNRYLEFLTVNERGGVGRAGVDAFANVTEDRQRLRARLRLGLDVDVGGGWTAGARLTTGDIDNPVSANQSLGIFGTRLDTNLDLLYTKWTGRSDDARHFLTVSGGRMPNPWFATELVWDNDLTFDGLAGQYRLGLGSRDRASRFVFATLGGFSIEEVELSSKDKWLLGAQLGVDWKFDRGHRLRAAAALYEYRNIVGVRNVLNDETFDFTAPRFLQRGNTLFDIRNDADVETNLYALASDFRIVNATLAYQHAIGEKYRVAANLDYARNVGFDEAEVQARIGTTEPIEEGTEGYLAEVSFGHSSMAAAGAWRAFVGYRYLEGDAVLDAFTDSNFRLGGTGVEGFIVGGDYAFTPRVFARLRYLSGNEIRRDVVTDRGVEVLSSPFGVDVIQLDLNTSF